MREFLRNLSLCFAVGCFGGLCYALGLWAMGHYGFTHWLGVDLAPRLNSAYLYQRIVWGGLCGLLLMLPWRSAWLLRGTALAPWAALQPLCCCVCRENRSAKHNAAAVFASASGWQIRCYQPGACPFQ
ncbi:hypothetical protein [uncultured Microbulbifer sp.]|uniref:hypothetical protein n=1 Tax=uncultured Microbulbifer sp. TaxID=348147 RepID=UPI00261A803F|nr:hypothetical protein [uncultured Microbulbifer sp.]